MEVTEAQQDCIVAALHSWIELDPDRKKFATRVKGDHGKGKRRVRLDVATIRDVPELIRTARNIAYQHGLYKEQRDLDSLRANVSDLICCGDKDWTVRGTWDCSDEVGVRNSETLFLNGQFYAPNELFDWVDRAGAYVENSGRVRSPSVFHLKSYNVWVDSSQVRLATPLEMLAATAD